MLFGLLQLGFMATFLSEPLISGYTTGIAIHVITSQLRHILGVPSSTIRVDPGVFALQRVCILLRMYISMLCAHKYAHDQCLYYAAINIHSPKK